MQICKFQNLVLQIVEVYALWVRSQILFCMFASASKKPTMFFVGFAWNVVFWVNRLLRWVFVSLGLWGTDHRKQTHKINLSIEHLLKKILPQLMPKSYSKFSVNSSRRICRLQSAAQLRVESEGNNSSRLQT